MYMVVLQGLLEIYGMPYSALQCHPQNVLPVLSEHPVAKRFLAWHPMRADDGVLDQG